MIEDVFALCFGSVEGDGALVLGAAALPPGVTLLYTPLLRSQVSFVCQRNACVRILFMRQSETPGKRNALPKRIASC